MNFNNLLNNAKTIQILGDIFTPPGYLGETHFIIPDEIVHFCLNYYSLLKPHSTVLDPMCGIGTIPRIINAVGGDCLGIEIDESKLCFSSDKVLAADFLKVELPEFYFSCIFTSLPFDWFKNDAPPMKPEFALKFKKHLKNDGFILLDVLENVTRDGQSWPVALRQCEYLEAHHFSLTEILKFQCSTKTGNIDESLILKFS